MERKTAVSTVIAVVALVLVAGLLWRGSANWTPGAATTTPPAENRTKIYENQALGVRFEYPGRYFVIEHDQSTGARYRYAIILMEDTAENRALAAGVSTEPREGPPTISFDLYQNNLDNQALETWIRSSNDSNFKLSPDGVLTSTTVAGLPALGYRWSGLYEGESTAFVYGDYIGVVSVTWLEPGDQIVTDFRGVLLSLELSPDRAQIATGTPPRPF